jgi:hypothetical protein
MTAFYDVGGLQGLQRQGAWVMAKPKDWHDSIRPQPARHVIANRDLVTEDCIDRIQIEQLAPLHLFRETAWKKKM